MARSKVKKTSSKIETIHPKAKFIFNPHAGKKRNFFSIFRGKMTALEDIKQLLDQYQIPVDYFPTKAPGHATQLAKDAVKEGYHMVIVAGGDGTVGEVANGLVNTDIILGILPLGSFMNIARMMSIPFDLEKAVTLIKIGRSRKIDVGCVTTLGGEKLDKPYYFIESVGMGLEAQLHRHVLDMERGDYKAFFAILKSFFDYYNHRAKITLDHEVIQTRATLVTVSNGPYSGAAIPLAPQAKLNDHRLTVRLFRMEKWELFKYFIRLITFGHARSAKVISYQTKEVKIETHTPRMVHADARLYGETPIKCSILPNALNIITGFPKKDDPHTLIKRTYLDY